MTRRSRGFPLWQVRAAPALGELDGVDVADPDDRLRRLLDVGAIQDLIVVEEAPSHDWLVGVLRDQCIGG
jgi:hypothetical protein